jgi:uncharacterized membrane protein YhaH (DUF805 family)
MTKPSRLSYLTTALWILAALLAWTAVAIRYARDGEMNWAIAAAGVFLFAAGLSAWFRARQLSATSLSDDRSRTPPT